MRVVFLQDVPDVAQSGDVKDVADGYARNFLFPQNLAKTATREALEELERAKKAREKQALDDLHRTEVLAERLDGYEVMIKVKASPTGTLYAALNRKQVADALARQGFEVPEEGIEFKSEEDIKEGGDYDAVVHLDHGLEAEIKIVVEVV